MPRRPQENTKGPPGLESRGEEVDVRVYSTEGAGSSRRRVFSESKGDSRSSFTASQLGGTPSRVEVKHQGPGSISITRPFPACGRAGPSKGASLLGGSGQGGPCWRSLPRGQELRVLGPKEYTGPWAERTLVDGGSAQRRSKTQNRIKAQIGKFPWTSVGTRT